MVGAAVLVVHGAFEPAVPVAPPRRAAPGAAPRRAADHHRRRRHARAPPDRRSRRQGRSVGRPARGDGHREGRARRRASSSLAALGFDLRAPQLRRPSGRAPRERALRIRARGVHRRRAGEAGAPRDRRRRKPVPRRDRRAPPHGAGQAPARPREPRDHARRRPPVEARRRADHLRDQPRSGLAGPLRRVPAGSLLPAQRHHAHHPAAAIAAQRDRSPCARVHSRGVSPRRAADCCP